MKLNQKLELLLIQGAKQNGLDVDGIMCQIGEYLTQPEYDAIEKFIKWLVANKKTYGWGNIQAVWKEWQTSLKSDK